MPSKETDTAELEFLNFFSTTVKENKDSFVKFDKQTDVLMSVFGSFSWIPTNLSCYERCSKCWWCCPMFKLLLKLSMKGDLVLMVNIWLKINYLCVKINCSEAYPQSHAELWFRDSWFGYFRAKKRNRWERKSLLKIVSWLNWMKRFWR